MKPEQAARENVNIQSDGGRITISGDLTFHTTPGLYMESRSWRRSGMPTELDLTAVKRFDSAGLSLLLEWTSWAREQDKGFALTSPPEQLCRLVSLYGFADILDLGDACSLVANTPHANEALA